MLESWRATYFSQHMGASFTNRSMVMSPADVSSKTDILVAMPLSAVSRACGQVLTEKCLALTCVVESGSRPLARGDVLLVSGWKVRRSVINQSFISFPFAGRTELLKAFLAGTFTRDHA